MNAPSNLLEWLASLPFDVAVFVLYVPALVLTAFGTLLVRWLFSDHVAPESSVGPTKVGFMAQVYSVMLGFLVAATYAQYGETRTWVRQEVESLRLIRNITSDVATPQAEALKTAVSDYARERFWEPLGAEARATWRIDRVRPGNNVLLHRRDPTQAGRARTR